MVPKIFLFIAKFTNYKDHELVRKNASKLKDKPQFSISQQYPTEISSRRQKLYPKMKEFQRQGKRATLVYDKLIVDGRPYDPPPKRDQGQTQVVQRIGQLTYGYKKVKHYTFECLWNKIEIIEP